MIAKKNLPCSHIVISERNLVHNIRQFKNLAGKGIKFSVAIKGNAYGHGQNIVAKILEHHVDYFQTDSIEELKLLRKISDKKTFVFGYVQKSDLKETIKLGCILSIFSVDQLKWVNSAAAQLKTEQEIHIPVDAYLGREGFLLRELPAIFQEIKNLKSINLTGIYAHFANIEDTSNPSHSKKQIREFERTIKLAGKFGFKNLQTHISATSGLLVYEKTKHIHSLIRLGIGVYGMWPSRHLKSIFINSEFNLKPVLSWMTKVAQVKTLPKGSTIGYGLTYRTKKKTKIAIITQGYADGVPRGFSNNGQVLIRGDRCKILGRVMMNMFVVDVSRLRKINVEDEVVILGSQGREEITAEEMAERIQTINYEITTRISALLPRFVR